MIINFDKSGKQGMLIGYRKNSYSGFGIDTKFIYKELSNICPMSAIILNVRFLKYKFALSLFKYY